MSLYTQLEISVFFTVKKYVNSRTVDIFENLIPNVLPSTNFQQFLQPFYSNKLDFTIILQIKMLLYILFGLLKETEPKCRIYKPKTKHYVQNFVRKSTSKTPKLQTTKYFTKVRKNSLGLNFMNINE